MNGLIVLGLMGCQADKFMREAVFFCFPQSIRVLPMYLPRHFIVRVCCVQRSSSWTKESASLNSGL